MKSPLIFGCALTVATLSGCSFQIKPTLDPFYRTVLAQSPSNPAALFSQSQMLMRQGLYVRAEPYLERLVAVTPADPQAWETLGQCRVELGKLSSAESAYRKALELTPTPVRMIGLAEALALQGKTAEARPWADKAQAQAAPPAALARLRGDLAYMEKDYASALKFYKKSLQADSSQKDLASREGDLEQYLTSPR